MTLYYFPFGKANESAWKNKIYVKISTKRETFFIFFRFGMKIPRKFGNVLAFSSGECYNVRRAIIIIVITKEKKV